MVFLDTVSIGAGSVVNGEIYLRNSGLEATGTGRRVLAGRRSVTEMQRWRLGKGGRYYQTYGGPAKCQRWIATHQEEGES